MNQWPPGPKRTASATALKWSLSEMLWLGPNRAGGQAGRGPGPGCLSLMAWVKPTLKEMNQRPHPTWKKRCFKPVSEPRMVGKKARNPRDIRANAKQARTLRFEGAFARGQRNKAVRGERTKAMEGMPRIP